MKKFTLFCLPHAGGNKYAYKKFVDCATSFMEVIPLEYPGRGEKLGQQPITNAELLANAMVAEVEKHSGPYAIYGHSMGTLIGLLVTRKLRKDGRQLPEFLFFAGSEGPSKRRIRMRHHLCKNDLIKELKSLGGLPEDLVHHPDVFDFFEPIIRADFQAIETYEYKEDAPLSMKVIIAIGTEEEVTLEEARSWQRESVEPIELIQFPGNHFFVFSHVENIMKLITERFIEINYAINKSSRSTYNDTY